MEVRRPNFLRLLDLHLSFVNGDFGNRGGLADFGNRGSSATGSILATGVAWKHGWFGDWGDLAGVNLAGLTLLLLTAISPPGVVF